MQFNTIDSSTDAQQRVDEAMRENIKVVEENGVLRTHLATAQAEVGRLSQAIEKFLNDTNAIPPWESAGSIWVARIKELHAVWLDVQEAQSRIKELEEYEFMYKGLNK